MTAYRIIFAIVTLLPLSLSGSVDDEVLKIELEIPLFLQGLLNNVLKSNKLMRTNTFHWNNSRDNEGNFLLKITTKGLPEILRRSQLQRKPMVEIGPGVFKSEIVTYPPNYLEDRLKYLLMIKARQSQTNV